MEAKGLLIPKQLTSEAKEHNYTSMLLLYEEIYSSSNNQSR